MIRHDAEYGTPRIVATTTAVDGRWFKIQFLGATVFASLTAAGADASASWDVSIAGVTFPQYSQPIYGDFTHVKLVSGQIMCYNQNVAT